MQKIKNIRFIHPVTFAGGSATTQLRIGPEGGNHHVEMAEWDGRNLKVTYKKPADAKSKHLPPKIIPGSNVGDMDPVDTQED